LVKFRKKTNFKDKKIIADLTFANFTVFAASDRLVYSVNGTIDAYHLKIPWYAMPLVL